MIIPEYFELIALVRYLADRSDFPNLPIDQEKKALISECYALYYNWEKLSDDKMQLIAEVVTEELKGQL